MIFQFTKYKPCPFGSGLRKFALEFVIVFFFKNAENITSGGLILYLKKLAFCKKYLYSENQKKRESARVPGWKSFDDFLHDLATVWPMVPDCVTGQGSNS